MKFVERDAGIMLSLQYISILEGDTMEVTDSENMTSTPFLVVEVDLLQAFTDPGDSELSSLEMSVF